MQRRKTTRVFGRSIDSQVGSTLLELSLMLPIIYLIFAWAIDAARIMRLHEDMSILSREGANAVLRTCIDGVDSQDCIDDLRDQMRSYHSAENASEYDVIFSIYDCTQHLCTDADDVTLCEPNRETDCSCRCVGDSSNVELRALSSSDLPDEEVSPFQSRFDAERVRSDIDSLLDERGYVTVTEVVARFRPIFPLFPAQEVYEPTIY